MRYEYKYLSKPLYQKTISIMKLLFMNNQSGKYLHIVLDDGNLRDCDIEYCIDNMINKDVEEREPSLECARNLLKMTIAQRYAVIGRAWEEYCEELQGGEK